jgi:hypothetical protein
VFGFRIRKIFVPLLYLFLSSLYPDSNIIGYVCGIMAALVLKYGGFYTLRLLPRLEWITAWEQKYNLVHKYEQSINYMRAQEPIEEGFNQTVCAYLMRYCKPRWPAASESLQSINYFALPANPDSTWTGQAVLIGGGSVPEIGPVKAMEIV